MVIALWPPLECGGFSIFCENIHAFVEHNQLINKIVSKMASLTDRVVHD